MYTKISVLVGTVIKPLAHPCLCVKVDHYFELLISAAEMKLRGDQKKVDTFEIIGAQIVRSHWEARLIN